MTGIYIHIPFCKSKCPYCDFYSFKANESDKDSYLNAVLLCLKNMKDKVSDTVDTLYFGGGTPSVFGSKRIAEVIEAVKENYNLKDAEITVECNPSSVDDKFFGELKIAGVNRISMGMQSAITEERKILGRHSDSDEVRKAVESAKRNGIENISLDLMLGVPNQTRESLKESIDFLISLDIKHISAYMLKIEEDTPFYKMQNDLALPDEDEVSDMYLFTIEELERKGFMQYEISNFSKKGFESRHNLHYWHDEEYLGIGPSAHSFLGGKRFYFERDFSSFISNPTPVFDCEGGDEEEYIMLALRLTQGLSGEKFKEKYGHFPKEEIYRRAREIEKTSFIKTDGKNISLTKEGFLISNTIIGKLLD